MGDRLVERLRARQFTIEVEELPGRSSATG
jgi:hypothetical protein